MIQLQDFPAPPLRYLPQDKEPLLVTAHRVRLVTGFSGAGKTSWVSQTALHTSDRLAYYDVADISGPALANAVARELAARLFGKAGGKLGEILLPGATGTEILFAIGRHLAESNLTATLAARCKSRRHRASTEVQVEFHRDIVFRNRLRTAFELSSWPQRRPRRPVCAPALMPSPPKRSISRFGAGCMQHRK